MDNPYPHTTKTTRDCEDFFLYVIAYSHKFWHSFKQDSYMFYDSFKEDFYILAHSYMFYDSLRQDFYVIVCAYMVQERF